MFMKVLALLTHIHVEITKGLSTRQHYTHFTIVVTFSFIPASLTHCSVKHHSNLTHIRFIIIHTNLHVYTHIMYPHFLPLPHSANTHM